MKKGNLSFIITLLFVFIFQSFSFSQENFEGKINLKMTSNGESHEMSYLVKNNKMRMEVNEAGHSAVILFDPVSKKMTMLMPQQNMYMEMPINKEIANEMNKDNEDVKFTKTGETRTINGYKCEKWIYKSKDEQGEAWMTKDLGKLKMFSGYSMQDKSNQPEWMKEIESEGAFPMLVNIKDNSGNDQGKMEVTSVNKESLDASLFKVPAGYHKFEMPGMNSGK